MEINNNIIYTILIINMLIISYYIYNYLKSNTDIFKKKCNLKKINNFQKFMTNWKTFGFSKIKHYLINDIDYINDYINGIEKNYPDMINSSYNNNLVSNINRKTIELIRDGEGKPFPFNKEKFHKINRIGINGFPSDKEEMVHHNKVGDDQTYMESQGVRNNNMDPRERFMQNLKIRKEYMKYSKKEDFMFFIKDFSNNLKKLFPEIVKPDFSLYHILVFYLYPGGKTQEIHSDKFYFENINGTAEERTVDTLQVFIALNDHELNSGPTTFYKRNMIDQNYLKEKELSNRIWKDQLKNDPKISDMFNKAKVQEKMNKGDIIFSDKDVYHHGGENKSNKIRKVLLIQYM